MNLADLKKVLCDTLCADVHVHERGKGLLFVSTPFSFSDGDSYSIYIKELPSGRCRISDMGGTFMHLSYEKDTDKFREGTRGKILSQIISEMNLKEEDGEFYIDTPANALGESVFRFGQAITRLHDLTFLNRLR